MADERHDPPDEPTYWSPANPPTTGGADLSSGEQAAARQEPGPPGDTDTTPPLDDVISSVNAGVRGGGMRIGHYRLIRQIAVGGMGAVYEAVQDQPRRTVAVKLIRFGRASRAALRRFEYESQLLARLHHPGIAQVYEAGTHSLGNNQSVPFYAMELIPGARALTDYARDAQLSVRGRLELFALVCDALQHAHEKGVLHRDIKPHNILVDSSGRPKVIDFGIARAIDADLAPPTLQTETRQLLGTLQYMSPEQVEGSSRDLDARCDVYALGVVLYELLCGRLPYDLNSTSISAASRIIREVAPLSPRKLNRLLDEDVETVMLTALHKDRSRRYRDAGELAADVRHVLAGEPIRARPDSATYLIRRRVRGAASRHQLITLQLCTLGAIVFSELLFSAVRHWRASDLGFENFTVTRLTPWRNQPFEHVRMIALNDGVDYGEVARRHGLQGVTMANNRSLRRLHGLLLKRLAATGPPRAVMIDIGFRGETEFDADLAAGIEALNAVGCDVTVADGPWPLEDAESPTSPPIRSRAVLGHTSVNFGSDGPWALHLALNREPDRVKTSLVLATYAVACHPGMPFTISLRAGVDSLDVQLPTANATLPARFRAPASPTQGSAPSTPIMLTVSRRDPTAAAQNVLLSGDVVGYFYTAIPTNSALGASTLAYEDVLGAGDEQLRPWLAEKVIVLGDARDRRDGPHATPDGRSLPAFIGLACGIDQLLSQRFITQPRYIPILNAYLWGRYLLSAFGACAGAAIGMFASSAIRRWLGLLISAALLVGFSLALFRFSLSLYNPFPALLAMILAAELVALAGRVRQKGLQ